ncbi:MAG: hypothetical protein J2P18_13155 [Nocardia sp.]|nr:hypothetical protein [Nocardia sp.]
MGSSPKALLEGGPADLPRRIVPITPPGSELRVHTDGGYERFKSTARRQITPEGDLPVYEWIEHVDA